MIVIKNEFEAKKFCSEFIERKSKQKYILGRNDFSKSVAELVNIDGFIDEFTDDNLYLNKPIIKSLESVPNNALVLSCTVCGKPITVLNKLQELGIEHIDYYTFLKYSGLKIKEIHFWDGFKNNYDNNKGKYDWLSNRFADNKSLETYNSILNFRLSYDLTYMESFEDLQYKQYFEDFLDFQDHDEVFVDVGGYDGYTSKYFIKHCPQFNKIFFLEPDAKNLKMAKEELHEYLNIEYFEIGASNKKETLRFENELGTSSKISETGSIIIEADAIDNLIHERVTFIKMDIEGSESVAIEGAKQTILKYHPRLAICVYHKGNDLIDIPEQVLAIRNDYDIYLRHYTEGVVETVMFFIPQK